MSYSYYALHQFIWNIKEKDCGHHSEYTITKYKHFVGIFDTFELACKQSFSLKNAKDWPTHIWINEIYSNDIQYLDEDIDIPYSSDYYILNDNEKCIFNKKSLIYGNMSDENVMKYNNVLKIKIEKPHELCKNMSIQTPDYNQIFQNGSFDNILNNPSFVFSLSVNDISKLDDYIKKNAK
jgi:hypothetical protein